MTDTVDDGPDGAGRPPGWHNPPPSGSRQPRRLLWDTDVAEPAADAGGPTPAVLPPEPGPGLPPPWPGQLTPGPPPPMPPTQRPRTGPPVAAIVAIAAIVLVAVATVVIVGVRGGGSGTAASGNGQPSGIGLDTTAVDPTAVDPTAVEPSTVDATTVEPTTPEPTTDAPTTEPSAPVNGYTIVPGPAGIHVPVPDGWSVHAGAAASNLQADDPATEGRFLRFGGDPLQTADLLSAVRLLETSTPTIRAGYQRIRLAKVNAGPTREAVDWEFTFTRDGGTRHAYGRYWLQNGIVYVVYLSSAESDWLSGTDILTTVIDGATVS